MEQSIRDQVFVSYSHKDLAWLEKLETMLKPLIHNSTISLWADTKIEPGQEWKEEIAKAIASAKVAVLLVSPDFLASDFITKHELPPLLDAARTGGLKVVWIPVSECLFEETEVAGYQAAHDPTHPLDSLEGSSEVNKALKGICRKIQSAVVCGNGCIPMAGDDYPESEDTEAHEPRRDKPDGITRAAVRIGGIAGRVVPRFGKLVIALMAAATVLGAVYVHAFYQLREVMPDLCPVHLVPAQSNAHMRVYIDRQTPIVKAIPLLRYNAQAGSRYLDASPNSPHPAIEEVVHESYLERFRRRHEFDNRRHSLHYVSRIEAIESWTSVFLWSRAQTIPLHKIALSAGGRTGIFLTAYSRESDCLRVGLKDMDGQEAKVSLPIAPGWNTYVIPLAAFRDVDTNALVLLALAHESSYSRHQYLYLEILDISFRNV